jgi:hypothetical protein
MTISPPILITNFISNDEADTVAEILSGLAVRVNDTNRWCALGFENSVVASSAPEDSSILPPSDNPKQQEAGLLVSKLLHSVRREMESYYGFELSLVNSSYTEYHEGTGIPMHSDSTKLDGSPFRDDGIPEELEVSAVLYLNDGGGVDFTGGNIEFPNQGVAYTPKKGTLIHFPGDLEHKHEVHPITLGSRKVIIYFYGRKGNVSLNTFFTPDSSY